MLPKRPFGFRLSSIVPRLGDGASRAADWADGRPRLAWAAALLLVLVLVGSEVSYWPRNDFPGAMWHSTPRGDDIEITQARAAKAGWREALGYWHGDWILGNHYYR